MIKNHKFKAIFSSVVILLPILFGIAIWDKLPTQMASHWGADGTADGFASKGFLVIGLPLILLAVHWLCLLATSLDKKNKLQNKKIVTMIYCMVPVISLVMSGFTYAAALGKAEDAVSLLPILFGVMFIVLGNYMPKTTRNRTFGLKIKWTMGNDENWYKTHRLTGKLSVAGGAAVLVATPVSFMVAMVTMFVAVAVMVVAPTVYSYQIYKKHLAEGITYEPVIGSKAGKTITVVLLPLILAGVAVIMFVGDISVSYGAKSFQVSATFSGSLTVEYDAVDHVEYRDEFSAGNRVMGIGSARLSVGTFQNSEFGNYTLYGYTGGEGCVVVKQGENILVIVGKTAQETKGIYDALIEKCG